MVVHPEAGCRFGNLMFQNVNSYDGTTYKYLCTCDCSETMITSRSNLLSGKTWRCTKCFKASKVTTPSDIDSKVHRKATLAWHALRRRAGVAKNYEHVTVCEEWKPSPSGFYKFIEDMGYPTLDMTIDRIDNSKGYSKENCRWATSGMQNHNKKKRCDAKTSSFIGVSFIKRKITHIGTWYVQFYFEGMKHDLIANSEIEAATHFDNLSEKYYGDRPNNTERREITEKVIKAGGVSFCKKSNRYRARVTFRDKRIHLGFFKTESEAYEVLNAKKKELNLL